MGCISTKELAVTTSTEPSDTQKAPDVSGTGHAGEPHKASRQAADQDTAAAAAAAAGEQEQQHLQSAPALAETGSADQPTRQSRSAARRRKASASSLHNSTPSGRAFTKWAIQQAASAQQSLEEFVSANIGTGALADGSSSGFSGGSFAGSTLGSMSSSNSRTLLPFQPHDVLALGPPKPACHVERSVTAAAIMRSYKAEDGELEAILGALCKALDIDNACITLLMGDIMCGLTACGFLTATTAPTSIGFCGWTSMTSNHELLVMEDAEQDARTADNVCVLDPDFHLRFYVGAPLIGTDGHRIGTMCIMDKQPRKFDATRAQFMANMAEMLVRQLERNRVLQLRTRMQQDHSLMRSLACYHMAYMLVDAGQPDWRVIYMNKAAQQQLGTKWMVGAGDLPALVDDVKYPLNLEGVPLESYFNLRHSCTKWAPFGCEFAVCDVLGASGTPSEGHGFVLNFRPATGDSVDADQPFSVGIPPWLSATRDGFGRNLFFLQFNPAEAPSYSGNSMSLGSSSVLSWWSSVLTANANSVSLVPKGLDPMACPVPGLVLGPLLGKGSYGRVYRGVYKGVPVAVKIIEDVADLRITASGELLEAVLTQGLHHPGIMRTVTYAYSPDERACWVLFEYCDRTSLQDAVWKGWFRTNVRITTGGVDLHAVAVTAHEIASGMAFLHKHDIVHGALKGGNVMLCSSTVNLHGFTAKVGDFGLARRATSGPHCPDNAYESVAHLAPETLLNKVVDKPMDVYAFGVLLWEMLTTSRAWAGMKHSEVICQVALTRRQLAVPEGLPVAIERLLVCCLAPQAARRCTFEEVLVVLSEFLNSSSSTGASNGQALPVLPAAAGEGQCSCQLLQACYPG